MSAKTYALVNQLCGHAVAVANNREQVANTQHQLVLLGRYTWVMREATDADMACLVDGVRCRMCDLTPLVVL